jgi:hypothetical protein
MPITHEENAMKQRTAGTEIASRNWNNKQVFYVAQVPGDGGKDWGYTTDRAKALPLNRYFMRRFVADCGRVGAIAFRAYA